MGVLTHITRQSDPHHQTHQLAQEASLRTDDARIRIERIRAELQLAELRARQAEDRERPELDS